ASSLPSGETATQLSRLFISRGHGRSLTRPSAKSQRVTPEIRGAKNERPSGAIVARYAVPCELPSLLASGLPVAASHQYPVPSRLVDVTRLPSGEKRTASTIPTWPANSKTGRLLSRSQSWIVDPWHTASAFSSGEKASLWTATADASSWRSSLPEA